MTELRLHYVYLITRPDGSPCYVGKGKGDRWLVHEKRCTNKRLWRLIQKSGGRLPRWKLAETLTDEEARELEVFWIKTLGRIDLGTGYLFNLTDGGEGHNPSHSQREAISRSRTGKRASEQTRDLQSQIKKNDPLNSERLVKARSLIGPETEQRSQRRREGQQRRWARDGAREEYSEKNLGRVVTDETRVKIKSSYADRDPAIEKERCAKIKVAAERQWALRRAQAGER